jgi:hypothetical protein
MKARQLANNQIVMSDSQREMFQSYDTVIAIRWRSSGKVELDKDKWNYSKTTAKYRNQFLCETTKETQAKINSGEYKLCNLNK